MDLIREINQRLRDEIAVFEELERLYSDITILTEERYEGGLDWEAPANKPDLGAIRQSVQSTGDAEKRRRQQQGAPAQGDIVRAVINGKPALGKIVSMQNGEIMIDFPSIGKRRKVSAEALKLTDVNRAMTKIKSADLEPAKRDALLQQYQKIAKIVGSRGAKLFAMTETPTLGL